MITLGNWKLKGNIIITNKLPNRIGYAWEDYESEYNYYGGYIICESIASQEDGLLIENSKELFREVNSLVILNEINPTISFDLYIVFKKIILKITKDEYKTPFYIIPLLYDKKLLIQQSLKYTHHSYYAKNNT